MNDKIKQALEACSALINYQFTGSSESMNALQHADNLVQEALASLQPQESGEEGEQPFPKAWPWHKSAEAAEKFLAPYSDADMEKLLNYDVQPIIRQLAAMIGQWQQAVAAPSQPQGDSGPRGTAKQRYDACMEDCEEPDPIERLRFFCSLAMNGQDWLDVEEFFDAITNGDSKPAEPTYETLSQQLTLMTREIARLNSELSATRPSIDSRKEVVVCHLTAGSSFMVSLDSLLRQSEAFAGGYISTDTVREFVSSFLCRCDAPKEAEAGKEK